MADRFWVGGTGTWNDSNTAHWSATSGGSAGASAPTNLDDAKIDANSGSVEAFLIQVAATAVCNNMTVSGVNLRTFTFNLQGNFSPAGTVSISGASTINRVLIKSNNVGTARTLTANPTLANIDFMDITAAGTTPFTGTSMGDCGGNSGITFDTSATQTFAGGTKNWSDVTVWTSRVPLPQDDVVVSTSGSTLTMDMPRIGRNVDFTGYTGTAAKTNGIVLGVFGDFLLSTGMTWATAGAFSLELYGRGAQTFNSQGKNLNCQNFNVFASGGSYTLEADLVVGNVSAPRSFNHRTGGFDAAGFNVTAVNFDSTGGLVRSLTGGSGTWTSIGSTGNQTFWSISAAGLTFSGASMTILLIHTNNGSSSITQTFNGAGLTYGTLRYSVGGTGICNLTISGNNTFGTLDVEFDQARTLILQASSTQTITSALTLKGVAGQLLSLRSSTTTPGILSVAGAVVSVQYADIKDNTITPGGLDFPGGVNSGNNTGWRFSAGSPNLLLMGIG